MIVRIYLVTYVYVAYINTTNHCSSRKAFVEYQQVRRLVSLQPSRESLYRSDLHRLT